MVLLPCYEALYHYPGTLYLLGPVRTVSRSLEKVYSSWASISALPHVTWLSWRQQGGVLTADCHFFAVSPPICSICKSPKHLLYACPRFKLLTHDKMLSTVRSNNICLYFPTSQRIAEATITAENAKGHTTFYFTSKQNQQWSKLALAIAPMVSSHAESGYGSTLLMTCQMFVNAQDGTRIKACGLQAHSPRSYLSDCHYQLRSLSSQVCIVDLPCNPLLCFKSYLCFHLLRGC